MPWLEELAERGTFFCFSVDFGFEGRKLALVWALAGFGLLRVLLLLGFIVVWFALGWIGVLFSFIFFFPVVWITFKSSPHSH